MTNTSTEIITTWILSMITTNTTTTIIHNENLYLDMDVHAYISHCGSYSLGEGFGIHGIYYTGIQKW